MVQAQTSSTRIETPMVKQKNLELLSAEHNKKKLELEDIVTFLLTKKASYISIRFVRIPL